MIEKPWLSHLKNFKVNVDVREFLAGSLLVLLGVFSAIYAGFSYDIGTLSEMGPGFFPVVLGSLLTLFGVRIAFSSLGTSGDTTNFEWMTVLIVCFSLVLFALLLKPLGLIFSIIITASLSAVPSKQSLKKNLFTAVVIASLSYVIFVLGLSVVVPLWPWSP